MISETDGGFAQLMSLGHIARLALRSMSTAAAGAEKVAAQPTGLVMQIILRRDLQTVRPPSVPFHREAMPQLSR